jgi:hypothetical protein
MNGALLSSCYIVSLFVLCYRVSNKEGEASFFIGGEEEWRPLNMPHQRSVRFFTMSLGSNRHRINGGDGVELCFFACLHALRQWSKGRSVHGYFCHKPVCHSHGKTTNKRHMEGERELRQVGGG